MGQTVLQIGEAITNWGKLYYKLGQLLQIGAIITNWDITYDIDITLDITKKCLLLSNLKTTLTYIQKN